MEKLSGIFRLTLIEKKLDNLHLLGYNILDQGGYCDKYRVKYGDRI